MKHSSVDVAGTGFTVLDRVYSDQKKAFEALGGSCGNVLVSLAMLRRSVVPLLSLGSDEVGECLVGEFAEAGADTSYISRRDEIASPVLAQQLDTASGQHWFSLICPETDRELPRYEPIGRAEVDRAKRVLGSCAVFYTDRLSDAILSAMEAAAGSGALVYFEPSSVGDEQQFDEALRIASIIKYSYEQLGERITRAAIPSDVITIATHGANGLEVSQGPRSVWCDAQPAPIVKDTCGSGDMVSVGVIDWVVGRGIPSAQRSLDAILGGVLAGQRLASANCAFEGARGLFKQRGPAVARSVLDGDNPDLQLAFF